MSDESWRRRRSGGGHSGGGAWSEAAYAPERGMRSGTSGAHQQSLSRAGELAAGGPRPWVDERSWAVPYQQSLPPPFAAFPDDCVHPARRDRSEHASGGGSGGSASRTSAGGKRSFAEAAAPLQAPTTGDGYSRRDVYESYYQGGISGGGGGGGGGSGGGGDPGSGGRRYNGGGGGYGLQAWDDAPVSAGRLRVASVERASPGPGSVRQPLQPPPPQQQRQKRTAPPPAQLPPHQQQQQQRHQQQAAAGGGGGGPGSQLAHRTSHHGAVYTRLTQNIAALVSEMEPDREDLEMREQTIAAFEAAIVSAFRECPAVRVQPFGSYVSGLGTKESDIDLVITGVAQPAPGEGFYRPYERSGIAMRLDRAAAALYRLPAASASIARHFVIRNARMPVARFTLRGGLVVDLSIAGPGGPDAAEHLAQQVRKWPALRPLTLTVKAYLKRNHLNDVASGGLSSYGITYMVLAHLQEESKAGADTRDLGYMLWRFFRRFTAEFSCCTHVIATGFGGIVTRTHAMSSGADYFKNDDRIATVDPLTGRDCTEGCYQTELVLHALRTGDRRLSDALREHQDNAMSSLLKVDLLQKLMQPDDQPDAHTGDWPYMYNPYKRRA